MLPEALYTAAQVRELDRRAIENGGVCGYTLMERAGAAAFAVLRGRFPRARRVVVVCGPGNNGGDGYVLARLAHEAGLAVTVLALGEAAAGKGDAARARQACVEAGVAVTGFEVAAVAGADVLVDALLGTGLEREVDGEFRTAIEAINAARRPVLALDIPSGLHADTGLVMGAGVHASATVSFIGLKAGLFTGRGPELTGEVLFDSLGVPTTIYRHVVPRARRITETALRGRLARRVRDMHKRQAGHVLVIGGAPGMPGAALLCGLAAYRTGAGLVTLAVHPLHAPCIVSAHPELIAHGVATAAEIGPLTERATLIALGPGLGRSEWGRGMLRAGLASGKPLVVDADGLNLLADEGRHASDWILTPHPGEAARLLGLTVARIQDDRFAAVRAIAERYGGVCVLKGAGTLIAEDGGELIDLCDRGNPGMASGGVGDVLTGVIAALRAQGLPAGDAARLGVWLHATAGDDAAAAGGEIGLLASDLLPYLRRRLNRLSA